VKRALYLLLAILLCSCTAHSEGGEAAEPGRLRFMDRSDPLVEHTFEIKEVRADHSDMRKIHRARGVRVCEEGEHGTTWQEDCNQCRCYWGERHCPSLPCKKSPESAAKAAKFRAEMQDYNRKEAERDRALQQMARARGLRVCEEVLRGDVGSQRRDRGIR
jgi:hypothetical protein